MYRNIVKLCGVAVSVLAISATAVMAQSQEWTEREAELYEAAKAEGSVTWYVSMFNTEIADAVCSLFVERYPGVACNPVRATGQVMYQRLMQEIGARALQADVFSTNDVGQLIELKQQDHLAEYDVLSMENMIPSLREFGEPGYWFTASVAPFAISYNTDMISEEDAPKNWDDLLDPKWNNRIAIPHPGFSGSAGTWVIGMRDLYGWEFFERLEQNNPQLIRSVADGTTLVVSGERWLAVGPANQAASAGFRGSPIAPAYPEDGALLPQGATTILKDAIRPNAARLFAEFMLSREVSEFYVSDQRFPLHNEVAPPETLPWLQEMKLIRVPDQQVHEQLPEVQELFRDTFGI